MINKKALVEAVEFREGVTLPNDGWTDVFVDSRSEELGPMGSFGKSFRMVLRFQASTVIMDGAPIALHKEKFADMVIKELYGETMKKLDRLAYAVYMGELGRRETAEKLQELIREMRT